MIARPFVLHTVGMEIQVLAKKEFPERLGEIPQPPKQLYARGAWPSKETKYLAVVGSRALTPYGQDACEYLIRGLAGYPISIVSGLALGADACAHKAALAAGLHTIAVLGSGVDDPSVYPRANAPLATDILSSGGLLVSENPEGYKAQIFDFPKRNRIVVGLSQAVLVIEAGPKSGTLITARLSGEYNRDLLCVPHRINDPHGVASHTFLRIGGALVSEPLHILEALGIAAREESKEEVGGDEKVVYDLLTTPRSRTDLIRLSGFDPTLAFKVLTTLELKKLIQEEFGVWRRL